MIDRQLSPLWQLLCHSVVAANASVSQCECGIEMVGCAVSNCRSLLYPSLLSLPVSQCLTCYQKLIYSN